MEEARRVLPPKIFSDVKKTLEEYREKLEEAAKRHNIDVETLEAEVRRRVLVAYKRALIEPGEPIGTVTAQSLGEPTTQMVLRTFHFAGIAKLNVTLGLPRLKEIIDSSKKIKTPIMTVYLKKTRVKDPKKLERLAMNVQTKIERITLKRLSKRIVGTTIIEGEEVECTEIEEKKGSKKRKRSKKGESKKVFIKLGGKLDVEIDVEAVKKRRNIKDDKKAIEYVIKAVSKLSGVKCVKYTGGNTLSIYIVPKKEDVKYDEIADLIEKVYEAKISGVENIKRGIVEVDEETGEYIIRFEGSNILEVMKIPEVDETRVYTNRLKEIEEVLGIEAARNAVIHEMRYTMKESANLYVDVRHYMLLADAMTRYGTLLGLTRTGLIRYIKKSPLGKAAFEIPYKFIADAARSGERDPLAGVNESLIVGNIVKLGTGKSDVKFNLFEIANVKLNKEEKE